MNPAQLAAAARVTVQDLPIATRLSLRLGAQEREAVGQALGLALPSRIGTRTSAGARSALCLGPDEWVIEAAGSEGGSERDALATTLAELAARLLLDARPVLAEAGEREAAAEHAALAQAARLGDCARGPGEVDGWQLLRAKRAGHRQQQCGQGKESALAGPRSGVPGSQSPRWRFHWGDSARTRKAGLNHSSPSVFGVRAK